MPKFIFILFLFFCSLHAFSQNGLPNITSGKSNFSSKTDEKEKTEAVVRDIKETEIELLLKDNLCEILSIKASDFLNESLLKKLKANV
jgi:tRNA U38,U39,U40 pseudouridine synthase TruA